MPNYKAPQAVKYRAILTSKAEKALEEYNPVREEERKQGKEEEAKLNSISNSNDEFFLNPPISQIKEKEIPNKQTNNGLNWSQQKTINNIPKKIETAHTYSK